MVGARRTASTLPPRASGGAVRHPRQRRRARRGARGGRRARRRPGRRRRRRRGRPVPARGASTRCARSATARSRSAATASASSSRRACVSTPGRRASTPPTSGRRARTGRPACSTRSSSTGWAALPPLASVEIDGLGDVLFCHGSPRSDEEIVTAATRPTRLAPMLAGVAQRTVVLGHTHVQFDQQVDGTPRRQRRQRRHALRGPGGRVLGVARARRRAAQHGATTSRRFARARARERHPRGRRFRRPSSPRPPGADEANEFFERMATQPALERSARARATRAPDRPHRAVRLRMTARASARTAA